MPLDREIDPEEFERQKAGFFGFGDQTKNEKAWFKRWYVWVLPAAVLLGLCVALFTTR